MPKVTVALPTYNHEKFIAECLHSVLNQTFQDFEIIITDDGSTDKTVDVVKTYSDPRIRLFCFDKNQGACIAFNNSISNAEGDYVALLHSDDLFMPEKLEKQVSFLERNPEVGAVFSHARIIDEKGNDFNDQQHIYYHVFRQKNRSRFEWLNFFFYHSNVLCHPSVMVRREYYEKMGLYDVRFAQMADFDFWIRLCMNHEIHIIQEELTQFRVLSNELNSSGDRPDINARLMFEHACIMRNYLNIRTEDLFYKVFPEGRRYEHCFDERLIPFFIAMLALERDLPASRHFAITTIFELLGDEPMRTMLSDKCNFTTRDFINITGKYDLFKWDAIQKLAAKEREIAEIKAKLQALEQELQGARGAIESRQQELDRIEKSRGWRLLKKYMGN